LSLFDDDDDDDDDDVAESTVKSGMRNGESKSERH
jgi:hypothetical protein